MLQVVKQSMCEKCKYVCEVQVCNKCVLRELFFFSPYSTRLFPLVLHSSRCAFTPHKVHVFSGTQQPRLRNNSARRPYDLFKVLALFGVVTILFEWPSRELT